MKQRLYTIYDNKAQTHGRPFTAINDNVAIRSFAQAVRDPQTEFSKAPGDYMLYGIGAYDDDTGIIEPERAPVHIATGTDLLAKI